jgi:hypothetical protein
VAEGKSQTTPVLAPRNNSNEIEIWAAIDEKRNGSAMMLRLKYRPEPCLKIGEFTVVDRKPAPEGLLAGFVSQDASREVLFLAEDRAHRQLFWWQIDSASGELRKLEGLGPRSYPTAQPGQLLLWQTDRGACWLSRGGRPSEDGALPVDQQEKPELERFLTAEDTESFALLPPPPRNVERRKPVDGAWACVGSRGAVRCGWCGIEETAHLAIEPHVKGWNEDWFMSQLGFRPATASIGPVVPTQWGFVTWGIRPDQPNQSTRIWTIYVDFVSQTV